MTNINPYINFNGQAEDAFNFYKSIFGGEFAVFSRMKEMPPSKECEISDAEKEKVMHVSLPLAGGAVLMGSDVPEAYADKMTFGNNISISINAESRAKTEELFKGLSDGGAVTMPLADTFWGAYFGMLTDKFGINWMFNCDNK